MFSRSASLGSSWAARRKARYCVLRATELRIGHAEVEAHRGIGRSALDGEDQELLRFRIRLAAVVNPAERVDYRRGLRSQLLRPDGEGQRRIRFFSDLGEHPGKVVEGDQVVIADGDRSPVTLFGPIVLATESEGLTEATVGLDALPVDLERLAEGVHCVSRIVLGDQHGPRQDPRSHRLGLGLLQVPGESQRFREATGLCVEVGEKELGFW